MLVPPAAIAEMSHMEVTAATATMIIIIITQAMLTFPKDACNKVLPACFSLKKRKYLTFYLLVLTLINLLL